MSGDDDRKRRKRRFGEKDDDDKGSSGSGSGSAGAAPMKDDDTDTKTSIEEGEDDSSNRPTKKFTREEDIKERLDTLHANANIAANDLKSSIVDVPITTDYELTLFRMIYEYTQMAADTARVSASYINGFEEKIAMKELLVFHMEFDEKKGFIWSAGCRLKNFRVTSVDQKTKEVKLESYYNNGVRFAWSDLTIRPHVPDASDPLDYMAIVKETDYDGWLNLGESDERYTRVFLRDGRLFLIRRDETSPYGPQIFKDSITVKDLRDKKSKAITVPHHMSRYDGHQYGITNDGLFLWTNNTADDRHEYTDVFDRLTGKLLCRRTTGGSDTSHSVPLDTIYGTRSLVLQRFARVGIPDKPGFDIIDIDSGKTLQTIRCDGTLFEENMKWINYGSSMCTVKQGIWALKISNYLIFIPFPKADDVIITKIYEVTITEGSSFGIHRRLRATGDDDGSVYVFSVNENTGVVTVSIACPRSVVYTKSQKH